MKTLAFGDSFVKMFMHCPEVKHFKFKGKSIKELVKVSDTERAEIEKELQKTPNAKVNRVLFIFGQVDFNYVRYYRMIKEEPPLAQDTFHDYVKWVSTLNKNHNMAIVSIFPSPIREQHLISSLASKGSYFSSERTPELDARVLAEYKNSHETWVTWNLWIRHYCKQYNIDNITLFEEDVVPQEFRDPSNQTIHLRYVPVLKLVQRHIPITYDSKKVEMEERAYEKEKADRIARCRAICNEDKDEEIQEMLTKEPSSETRNCSSPEQFEEEGQKVKAYRKKTADELTIEKDSQFRHGILSDSKRKIPKYSIRKVEEQKWKKAEGQKWKKAEGQKWKKTEGQKWKKEEQKWKKAEEQKWKKAPPRKKESPKAKEKTDQENKTARRCEVEPKEGSEDEGQRFLSLAYRNKGQ